MNMKTTILFSFFLLAMLPLMAQKKMPFSANDLHIQWQLLTNGFEGKNAAQNQFLLSNKGRKKFPASGWVIYFSCSRTSMPAPAVAGLEVSHVNGDVFKLAPTADFKGIDPGKSVAMQFVTEGATLNKAGMPNGLYIVWNQQPDKGWALQNISRGPFLDKTEKYRTAAQTYERNAVFQEAAAETVSPVLPTPMFWQKTAGGFSIDGEVAILNTGNFDNEAKLLATDMKTLTGKEPAIATAFVMATRVIALQRSATLLPEGYELTVSDQQIVISAADAAGIFYGIQSLKALVPVNAWRQPNASVLIPAYTIKDQPRFGYRGLMVDVGRNFQSKEEVKRILELMSLYKLNTLHFHFSEDEGWRVQMPSIPELTEIGSLRGHPMDDKKNLPPSYGAGPTVGQAPASGFYTKDEFIDLLRYATARHIRVIPEVETPGHARAAVKSMEARYAKYKALGNMEEAERYRLADPNDSSVYSSAQAWTDNVICVARPSTYKFVERVVDDIIALYQEAGAPLETIHMGGDEVPDGAWEKSPICQAFLANNEQYTETNDLWYYYYKTVAKILADRKLALSGWEEVGMRKTKLFGEKKLIVNPRLANEGYRLYVWNNMVGWGNEDLPYRLANAGYKVVLAPVSNNYFDMSYYKDPEEPGFYWGGFVDIDKPFYFTPYDYFKNTKENAAGEPVKPGAFVGKDPLTDFGKQNILGLQGLIWAETLRSPNDLEYMILPKLLGMAERAWAKDPAWAQQTDKEKMESEYAVAWNQFLTAVGNRELPKLSWYNKGYAYRIPVPGLKVDNGQIYANMQLPGFEIRYTTDGSEPTLTSKRYEAPIPFSDKLRFKTFTVSGRGSRAISVTP
ncbi:MAG: carbohydate-binding domain-containing protein [Bacteroidetes bacterium]|nr:carbohydate-binding domain-containing protein [Bacteroidota bacterium]